jgi:ABC-type antimicrobial peptide transport system permease subunit
MRFLVFNHIQNARQSLKSNRVRSMLAVLGVTIGVASITAILALSGGASKIIDDQVSPLGGNLAIVRPGASTDTISNLTQAKTGVEVATSSITEEDIKSIQETEHVKSVAPIMTVSGTIKGSSTAPSTATVVATTPSFNDIANFKMREGQFLDSTVYKYTAVLGAQLSIDIFGTDSSIGRMFTIHGQQFTVIGVLSRMDNPINYNSIDFDQAVIINMESGKSINRDIVQIQQVNITADSVNSLKQTIASVDEALAVNHGGEKDFSILTGSQISQPTSQLFYTITGFTTAIAAISILVGGIGVMNIMLVTVAERTREIGIRKALGANNTDITLQFLIESLAISLKGSVTGYIMGYVLAFGISSFMTFDPIINWQIAVTALVISMIVGTLFGIYPAIRAAHKDPIHSLHQH